jgi:ankyrin repeat protein
MKGLFVGLKYRVSSFGIVFGAVLLSASLLSGCVQPKVLKYESFQHKSFSKRSKPAEYYEGSPEAIMRDGFLLIGYIDLKRNIRACYDDFTCRNISSEFPPRTELQSEAAERGGDRISLLEERIGLEKVTKSVCSSYTTQTYTIDGKVYTTTICASYLHYKGHREVKISKALVWRYEPQLATPEANLGAIRQAMDAMAKAYGVNPEKPQVADTGTPTSDYLDLLSNTYTDTRETASNLFGGSRSATKTGLLKAIDDDDPKAIHKEIAARDRDKWTATQRRSALVFAIISKKRKAISALLDNGFYELDRDSRGYRPVAYAAAKDDLPTLKRLVALGSKVKGFDDKKQTLLHSAASGTGSTTTAWLLKQGLDPDRFSANGFTPLMRAAYNSNLGVARLLLKAGADANARVKNTGSTVLMGAAAKDSDAMIRLLVRNGARVNASNKKRMTALTFAATKGNTSSVRALLKSGARINAVSAFGSPFRVAVRNKKWGTAVLLAERGASLKIDKISGAKWLEHAIRQNQHALVEVLLKRGISPNSKKSNPVLLAARWADGRMIRILARHGANLKVSHKGVNALIIAARNGNDSVVEELLSQKVHVRAKKGKGLSALDVATIYGHTGVVRAMRKAGVD